MKTVIILIRVLLCLISAGAALVFIYPISLGIINLGNISGIAVSVWFFILNCRPLHVAIREICKTFLVTRFLYLAVNVGFTLFLIYGAVVSGFMVHAMTRQPKPGSTAVVLGAQVHASGNPSTMLAGRIYAAEKYLRENPEAKAVLSGGQGSNEPMSEAQCMYENLIKLGVDPSRLYLEDKSVNTAENLKFSDKVIRDNDLNPDIVIVSDGFHQLRAGIIFDCQKLEGQYGAFNADTDIRFAPTYFVREWFGVPYQLLKE